MVVKRLRAAEDEERQGGGGGGDTGDRMKKKKQRKQDETQQQQQQQQQQMLGQETSLLKKRPKIGKLKDPVSHDQVSEWFTALYTNALFQLSPLELYGGGKRFTRERFFLNTADNDKCFFFHCDAIGQLFNNKKRKKLMVISAGAVRACALLKPLASLGRPIAKLFGKHHKLEDQVNFLKASQPTAAVGTPNRILKLAQAGCLDFLLDKGVVLIDLHRDVKHYSCLDMPMVSRDLMDFCRFCLQKEETKIGFII